MPSEVAAKLEGMMFTAPLSTAAYIFGLGVMTAATLLGVGDQAMASLAGSTLLLNLILGAQIAGKRRTDFSASASISMLMNGKMHAVGDRSRINLVPT